MVLIASNVTVPLDAMLPNKRKMLRRAVGRAIGADPAHIHDLRIVRRSVDARKKSNVHFVISATFKLIGDSALASMPEPFQWPYATARGVTVGPYIQLGPPAIPDLSAAFAAGEAACPLVVGAGPAGLFCALWLARAGMHPLLVERGQAVEERAQTVETFDAGGPLNPQSNIQFGEGGAGAFSDGKLTCGKRDPHIRHVLQAFVDAGAPEDILIDAKPHIGTDYLPQTVRGLREAIQSAGGEIRFNTQLIGLQMRPSADGLSAVEEFPLSPQSNMLHRVQAAVVRDLQTGEEYEINTDTIVLATGHSARDTVEMLLGEGAAMQRKPFAVGVRIEHPQELIDRSQYGKAAGHPALPPADYKLNVRTADGRGVYTFCMCPGGTVVAAASELGGVCTNGMSTHARDGRNANSALLVEVHPDDFDGDDVLAGVHFQRNLERTAYDAAQQADESAAPYSAPAQTVGSFLRVSAQPADAHTIQPTYPRGVVHADLDSCLPPFIVDSLKEALPKLDRKLHGFADPNAIMTAVEARSSSPVRIVRDTETRMSTTIGGLYPTGEGAGYAGGIMSAATDGIRTAELIMRQLILQNALVDTVKAAERLAVGRAVIVPTDTVVGLAVSPDGVNASPDALYEIKGRDRRRPISWLVGSHADLAILGREVPAYAKALADRFWPGPLTLVVHAASRIPADFAASDGTIGLRMPAHDAVRALLQHTGPLATTSANISDQPAPRTLYEVDPYLLNEVGCVLNGEDSTSSATAGAPSGVASTVVDCTGKHPCILRVGGITEEDIETVLCASS